MDQRMTWTGLALLGLFASTPVLAEIRPGFYVGAGVGEASVEVDDSGFDDGDTGFKVFAGYNINRHFALEATYFDGGTAEMSSAARAFGGSIAVSTSGLNFSLLGRLPVNEVFSVHARLGMAAYDVDTRIVAHSPLGQARFADSDSSEDVSYGLGAAFDISSSFELRAEYEAVDASNGKLSLLSVSGVYRF